MKPFDYIVYETERQSGTMREALGMYQAWLHLSPLFASGASWTEVFFLIASDYINGETKYRSVPVVFNQGTPAVDAANVPIAMYSLGRALVSLNFDMRKENADYFTKEFLEIHPFIDGNGRVGSLLWNYLNGTFDSPETMPYFFGEK